MSSTIDRRVRSRARHPGDGQDRLDMAAALVTDLIEEGCLPPRALAQVWGVPLARVHYLADARRCGALAGISAEQLAELTALRDTHCCARGRRVVWWLRTRQALGYPLWWQADQIGMPDLDGMLRRPGQVGVRDYGRVAALARRLGEMAAVPGREVPAEQVYLARAEARRLGYGPPVAYTEVGGRLPDGGWARDDFTRQGRSDVWTRLDPEIEETIVRLLQPPYGLAAGYSVGYLARRFGTTLRTIERLKDRHGLRTAGDGGSWFHPDAPPIVRQPLDLATVVPRPA